MISRASTNLIACLLLSLGGGSAATAADNAYACPEKVRLSSGTISDQDIADWKPEVPSSVIWLTGASVYDGPPQERASLVPTRTNKSGSVMKWVLEGSDARGVWIACDYGDGVASLVRRIPDASKQCTVTASKSGKPRVMKMQFVCSDAALRGSSQLR